MKRLFYSQILHSKLFMPDKYEKYARIEFEIDALIGKHRGALSGISAYLERDESSKISRQLNPHDTRRDNPFREVLEIIEGAQSFSPRLAAELWQILERERSAMREDTPVQIIDIAKSIHRVFAELSDVVFANNSGASAEVLEKEAFELMNVSISNYENIVARRKLANARRID